MAFRSLVAVALAASALPVGQAHPSTDETFGSSTKVAAQRGPQIFNTVYDSLRKWGAVVHPNGMSVFLATVPEGVMLHHGSNRNQTPTELDWLAFEIEHSEIFASARPPGRPPGPAPTEAPPSGLPPGFAFPGSADPTPEMPEELKKRRDSQAPLTESEDEPEQKPHGWLHTYRTTRSLRFLYVDGMSGNKGDSGVIDTQDFLLRGVRDVDNGSPAWPREDHIVPGPPGEHDRAKDLCQICADWGLQGIIRTESPGSEIIMCDFSDGLEQVQSLQRSDKNSGPPHGGPRGPGGPGGPKGPGGPRGPGGPWGPGSRKDPEDRHREVGSNRVLLDYSSMVSAYFFPVNLTNPDKEQSKYPRLINTSEGEMAAIKEYLSHIVKERYDVGFTPFHWRDIADLVVHRYADKIKLMAEKVETLEDMTKQVRFLTEVFIDYSVPDAELCDAAAVERCATFYIQTMPLKTEVDRLIYAAFKATGAEICTALLNVRKLTIGDTEADPASMEKAKSVMKELMETLDWNVFEE